MTPDQYIEQVLAKYAVPMGPLSITEVVANTIAPTIRQWAGEWLSTLAFSGSYAKETAVHGGTDVDLFISLKSNTPSTLREIYESLFQLALTNGWSPRRQDVSVGIIHSGVSVDLVPGRIQSGYQNYHSLYRSKRDSWTQTNVVLHINTVKNSQRTKEIRAIKVWRNIHQIEFPSIYLELTILEALKGRSSSALANNVLHALKYIGDWLPTTRVVDPANTNNIISEDLTSSDKYTIARQAKSSANKQYWKDIIW